MAGIGIRYLELARRLPGQGVDVVLVSPAEPEETTALGGLDSVAVRRFERGRLAAILGDCDGAVAQAWSVAEVLRCWVKTAGPSQEERREVVLENVPEERVAV